jgi:hypothetical protein
VASGKTLALIPFSGLSGEILEKILEKILDTVSRTGLSAGTGVAAVHVSHAPA